jgi:hypothetical protein
MRFPAGLGQALGQGVNQAFAEDPGIDANYGRSRELSQQAIDVIGQLGGLSAPEPVRPAYRTEDLIGLLVGGLLSGGGREIAPLVQGFQQGKLGKAQQDTEVQNQRFSQKADAIQRQGTILGQQAGIARQAGDDLLTAQNRRQDTMERRRASMESADIRREQLDERKRKTTLDGLIKQINGSMMLMKTGGPGGRITGAKAIQDLVDRNPEYRDQLLTYRDPTGFSEKTPQELLLEAKTETENTLRQGKFNVLMAQANKLASGAEVDAARIDKLAEDTRLMSERVANQTESLRIRAITGDAYAANVQSLIKQRPLQFGLDLAKSTGDALGQQIGMNKDALTANGLLMDAAKKRMDAMKGQHGDTSKQYLEAVAEFNALNTTQGQLEDTRNRLNNQVAAVKTALAKTLAADAAAKKANEEAKAKGEYVAPRALPGILGADNALPGNVDFNRLGNGPPLPVNAGSRPNPKKAPPAKDAFKRLKSKLGPNWGVNNK